MQIGVDQLSVLATPGVVTDASALVMALDKAQIKSLFTGRIRNGKELGGPDQAPRIQRPFTLVVGSRLAPGTAKAVEAMVAFILGPGNAYLPK